MIKCLFLLYRAPHLTPEQFSDYWRTKHSILAIETAPLTRMRFYAQNHRVDHPVAEASRSSRQCLMGDFDGIAEASWDSFDDMISAAGQIPAEILAAILKDEASFLDMSRSILWFGEEFPFWPPANP